MNAGCQASLIGDPNQGIYEVAGADGALLSKYGQRDGVNSLELKNNFRPVPPILDLANHSAADREAPDTTHGAFLVAWNKDERENLIVSFQRSVEALLALGLSARRYSVVDVIWQTKWLATKGRRGGAS